MTMVEAMISIFILLIMSMMIGQTMQNAIKFQTLLEDRDVTVRQARVAMGKIKREIAAAYLTPSQNAVDTVQTVFVAQDSDPDSIFFATMAHQRIYRDSRESDQSEITLWTEKMDRDKGQGYVLYHRESPRVDEEPDEQGTVYPLAYNVRSFNLRFLDPVDGEWKEEWDTRATDTLYRLPRSVEIALVLIADDPGRPGKYIDVPFLTAVNLQYGGRLMSESNPMANRGGQSPFGGMGNPLMKSPLAGPGAPWNGFGEQPVAKPPSRKVTKDKKGKGGGKRPTMTTNGKGPVNPVSDLRNMSRNK